MRNNRMTTSECLIRKASEHLEEKKATITCEFGKGYIQENRDKRKSKKGKTSEEQENFSQANTAVEI